MAERERLGRRSGFSHREYIYRTRDCFEIDEVEGYEVTRKRVFYDDVVLVTRHRFVPWAPIVASSVFAVLFALLALAFRTGARAVAFVFFALALALVALVAALIAVGAEAVTVQGKRTQARMDFVLRRGKAIGVYRRACRLVRDRQRRGSDLESAHRARRALSDNEIGPGVRS